MGIFKSVFGKEEKPNRDAYLSIYPCDNLDCHAYVELQLRDSIKKDAMFVPGYPIHLFYCLFCERFKRRDMYKKEVE